MHEFDPTIPPSESLGFTWDEPFNDGRLRVVEDGGGLHMAGLHESRLIREIERLRAAASQVRFGLLVGPSTVLLAESAEHAQAIAEERERGEQVVSSGPAPVWTPVA